jgi:hypothetical protein
MHALRRGKYHMYSACLGLRTGLSGRGFRSDAAPPTCRGLGLSYGRRGVIGSSGVGPVSVFVP